MNKILVLAFSLLLACPLLAQDPVQHLKGARPAIRLETVPDDLIDKGRIFIKFKRQWSASLKPHPAQGPDGIIRFNLPAVDLLNARFRVNKAPRSFESILKNTSRTANHKAWGFDLWYELEFPQEINIKKIIAAYSGLSNYIEVVEPAYKITQHRSVPPANGMPAAGISPSFTPSDTRFGEQWHYNNTGQVGGIAGDDIKLPQAWDLEKGKPSTICAIIDEGMQYTHPDLAQNMWPGIGYNFVNNNNIIEPGTHGTHTGGTVGAVSNNGIGVSGVAGGDGSPGSGVRLMSLEVFGPSTSASNFGSPFIWAADNGAMIAQNSWGYNAPYVYQQFVLDAIDYFIANGGGAVLKGGLVIFSAGNNQSELPFYPSYYDRVISVAATNNRDVRAWYSNYGTYVDISAPGGETSYTNDPHGVLSTVTGNSYAFLQGTSMACPHVSGVACLLASRAPGRFSNDDIKAILMATADNHYGSNSPAYAGKLGVGRLNAYRALQKVEELIALPVVDPVDNYSLSLNCPNIDLSWTNNPANTDVMIAYSANSDFGLPNGNYAAGDQIPGGGTVLFKGKASSFTHPIPVDSALITYKIWAIGTGNTYSAGLVSSIRTPYSLSGFFANTIGNTVQLQWTRNCASNEVLVATNTSPVFGIPTGSLSAGDALAGGGTVIYRGPANGYLQTNPVQGTNYYRIWPVAAGSNHYSQYAKDVAACIGSIAGPITEEFAAASFPPPGWQVINPDGATTWTRTTSAGSGGSNSAAYIRLYYYENALGEVDYLLSPAMDATGIDSAIFSFDRAYKPYSNTYTDSLEVVVSTDCGASFQTVLKLGGTTLASTPGYDIVNYVPVPAEWKNIRLDLRPYIGNSPSFLAGLKSVNQFGQNIYIDKINLYTVKSPARDAALTAIVTPDPLLCEEQVTAKLTLSNLGADTLKTAWIYYRFNTASVTGALDSIAFNGALPSGESTGIDLKTVTLPAGERYQLLAYSKLPNGFTDNTPGNDSIRATFQIFKPVPVPLYESMEAASFPPANWGIRTAANQFYTWQRSATAATNGSASALIRNFVYNSQGKTNDLYTPPVEIGTPDSLFLKFDLAHATAKYPGSTISPLDTLEILISSDCGNTFTSIYKKWGEDLSTVSPNFAPQYLPGDTVGFVPLTTEWRTERIDTRNKVNPNSRVQFIFRITSNKGNNLYLDNISVFEVNLPARLKETGRLIGPNPFNRTITIRHLLPPVNLKGLQVINSSGQVLHTRSFRGNAASFLELDMARYSSGIYLLKLFYTDKVEVIQLVKQ